MISIVVTTSFLVVYFALTRYSLTQVSTVGLDGAFVGESSAATFAVTVLGMDNENACVSACSPGDPSRRTNSVVPASVPGFWNCSWHAPSATCDSSFTFTPTAALLPADVAIRFAFNNTRASAVFWNASTALNLQASETQECTLSAPAYCYLA
jgi:hypothetical protein